MKINFLVNEVYDGWERTDRRLGGTEESVVRWAEELASRDNEVYVYRNGKRPKNYKHNDVIYVNRDSYAGGADVCINVKSSDIEPQEPTLYLTNETNANELNLKDYLAVIWPSNWAKYNIPVNNPNVFVLPHGYDSDQIYPSTKIRKQCFYASSPDRGLEELLAAWPEIYMVHPDATLIVTYNGSGPRLHGVMYVGDLDEATMDDLYRTSEYWMHPCTGGELFGITAIKAQAAGCWPIYVPTMALNETVKFGTKTSFDMFASDAIKALDTRPVIPNYYFCNWSDSTDKLIEIIENVV